MINIIKKYNINLNEYLSNYKIKEIKEEYKKLSHSKIKYSIKYLYLLLYKPIYNNKYIKKKLKEHNDFLSNICGYSLDINQRKAVLTDEDNTMIIAGAGSGKTLTMIGKIKYLLNCNNIKENEILCISFTNESTKSINKSLEKENIKIDVKTFHKLSLDILKRNNLNYRIADPNTLEYILEEAFNQDTYDDKTLYIYLKEYLKLNNLELDEEKQLINLRKIITTFINCFKSSNYNKTKFLEYFKEKDKKTKLILLIIYKIYDKYDKFLNENKEIDFNDMINIATSIIEENKVTLNYKYILIDEYQDTSITRYKLIKSIIDKTKAKLIVVGDDFQSIYGFTGCKLDIFLNFKKYFGKTKVIKINNTYRSPQEIVTLAGNFIMKNIRQIRKKLKANKKLKDSILICYYDNIIIKVESIINNILKETKKPILIIGRNNKDILTIIDNKTFTINDNKIIYTKDKSQDIYYLTAHKSKGLEEENVIIINLIDDILGFPNKIEDHNIIKLVNNKDENLIMEERRLFYVALTRTKNKVYLLTPLKNKSIFIEELIKNYKKYITFY